MSNTVKPAVKPAVKPRLRRANSMKELANPDEDQRFSSPVFYMCNSRKKHKEAIEEGTETEKPTSPMEKVQLDGECCINLSTQRRPNKKRLESLPDYEHELNRNQTHSINSDLLNEHKYATMLNESKYATMLPLKLSDRLSKEPEYAQVSPADETESGITAATVLQDIANNHLICNMCNKRYKAPKALNCLHSFCTSCLQRRLDRSPGPQRKISCPVCEKVTELSKANDLTGLKDSIMVSELLEDVIKLEKCLPAQKNLAPVDKATANHKGTTDYWKLNPYERQLSNNNEDDQADQTTQEGVVNNVKTCSEHPGQELQFYCKTCEGMVCRDCTFSRHMRHQHVKAASAVTVCRRTLDKMLPMIQKDCKAFTQAASSARSAYDRLQRMMQASKKKILKMEEQEVARVRAKGDQLRKKVTEVGEQRAEEIEELYARHCLQAQEASRIEGRMKHALTQATTLEILKMKQNLFDDITAVLNKEGIPQTHDLSFLDFKAHLPNPPTNINLGTLLTREKWRKMIDFGREPGKGFKQVGYVAVYSYGAVAATDMESWSLTVVKCGHHLSYMKELNELSKETMDRPYAIAINSNDQLLVIDNSRLRVFDKKMGFVLQVPTSFPENPVKNSAGTILSCLAVDDQNRIAVGHRGKEIISLHRQDGAVIHVVPAPMVDTQLTISNQHRFVYSNYEARKVLCIDYKGQPVFCVDTGNYSPTGVCCDGAGYIYVAMHTDNTGHCEIHQFDPDGVSIGCMVKNLDNPLGLTFTKDDQLVVADKYSVKIYHRA